MGKNIPMTNYKNYRAEKIMFYLEGIRNGTRIFPPSLQIALTDKCFNQCVMCGHWKREKKATLDCDVLINFLENAKICGDLQSVCYSGGDPMAYKDLDEIMCWHVENEIPFGIITAGYVPSGISMDLLREAEWIRVSLDAFDADVYSEVRGGVGIEKVKESVEKMARNGCNVEFGITLTKANFGQVGKLASFAQHLNVKNFRVWPVRHCEAYAIEEAQKAEAIARLESAEHLLQIYDIGNNIDEAIQIMKSGELQDFPCCKATLFQLFVTATGDIMPCCILAGDSNESALWSNNLGTIDDSCEDIMEAARKFSEIPRDSLPLACDGCTSRLQTINKFASTHWEDKYFV